MKYLTALVPVSSDASSPVMEPLAVEGGSGIAVAFDDSLREYGCVNAGGAVMRMTGADPEILSDAAFLHVSADESGQLAGVFMVDGSFIVDSADTLMIVSAPAPVSIDLADTRTARGYVAADGPVTLFFPGRAAERVEFSGVAAAYVNEEDGLAFTLSGAGPIGITWALEPEPIEPPLDVTAVDLPGDNGHRIELAWMPSPSEQSGRVLIYRIHRSRAAEPGETRSADSFATIEDLDAWEKTGTVLIDSVAVGETAWTDDGVIRNNETYYYWIEAVGTDGVSAKTAARYVTEATHAPVEFSLDPPRPNPFNSSVTIGFTLPAASPVRIRIYDVRGSLVRTLIDGASMGAGYHTAVWDGTNDAGLTAASGMYLFRLETGGLVRHGKMTFMK